MNLLFAHNLLVGLQQELPASLPARHYLSVNEFGQLQVTLFVRGCVQEVIFEQADFERPLEDLIQEVVRVYDDASTRT